MTFMEEVCINICYYSIHVTQHVIHAQIKQKFALRLRFIK